MLEMAYVSGTQRYSGRPAALCSDSSLFESWTWFRM
jgi:hypothetical protein